MNWQHKAFAQRLLSRLPCGRQFNYLLARRITGHIPAGNATLERDFSFARGYLKAFAAYGTRPIDRALFYEFGAGWDLIVPLSFYALGVNCQRLVDLRRLLRPWLVARTAASIDAIAARLGAIRALESLAQPASFQEMRRCLRQSCGINYQAPFDARHTGWDSESIDYITSTKVLCHVPPRELRDLLRECYRLVRRDGAAAFAIDYRDQYSYADSQISPYNFLQYSDQEWARFNPPLHYQNRLRHSDYRDLFLASGFEIVEELRACGDPKSREAARTLRLARRFESYDPEDLLAVRGDFVLKKGSLLKPAYYSDVCQFCSAP